LQSPGSEVARVEPERFRDAAGVKGTRAHEIVENIVWGRPNNLVGPDELHTANQFRRWWRQADLEPLATEEPVYHEAFQFAGSFDLLAVHVPSQRVVLFDWKSGKSARYPETFAQLAAYDLALESMGVLVGPTPMYAVHIPRDRTTFLTVFEPDHDQAAANIACRAMFKACLDLRANRNFKTQEVEWHPVDDIEEASGTNGGRPEPEGSEVSKGAVGVGGGKPKVRRKKTPPVS